MKIKNKRVPVVFACGLLLALCFFTWRNQAVLTGGSSLAGGEEINRTVVLDAGHGGVDPGKIGVNGANEKDVNLQIALLVKEYLEAQDVEVVMTRETEGGLYDENASNKKVQDMKRRITLIDEAAPALTVSIHQNSYPEEYVHGAQVFYYTGSSEGQRLAELLQASLIKRVDSENHRQVKANDSYYLLKKTATPIVIVECGFLSNNEEAQKLCDQTYQEQIAWAIHMGILQYLSTL
jgi:N-acetylmuramoyl-L-alanine amidase